MQTITVKVTDLGHESLLRTAKERGVSIEEIAEERLTEGDVYDGPSWTTEEEAAFDEEYHTKDRRALREWHESLSADRSHDAKNPEIEGRSRCNR